MWSPGIAAILTQMLFKEKVADLGWRLGERRYLFLGYVVPWIYALAIYEFAWLTGLGGYQPRSMSILGFRLPFLINLTTSSTVLLLPALFAPLGEEIGWRGLLVPELSKITNFGWTAAITGIIWTVWHLPAMFFLDYRSEAPLWFQLPLFTLGVLGMSVFTAWLRLKSGSVWPTVLWHGNHNLLVQGVFLSMTTDTGITEYIVDDFGVGFLLSSLVLASIFWMRRNELPS